jgi:hypothetical protein
MLVDMDDGVPVADCGHTADSFFLVNRTTGKVELQIVAGLCRTCFDAAFYAAHEQDWFDE